MNQIKQKIKLIYILHSLEMGGVEKLLLNICQNLDKSVFDITVITVGGGGVLEPEFGKTGVKTIVWQKNNKLALNIIYKLYKYFRQEQPDIVHTNIFSADTRGRIAAKLAGVPVVISTEHSIGLDKGFFRQLVKRVLFGFTDQIIAISQAVKDNLVEKEKFKAKKVKVIYNGIDLKKFRFRGFKAIDKEKINAVMVARLYSLKGHQYLIEAMPLILQKYPGFTLNLVGGGEAEVAIRDQARNLGVLANIKFWGEQKETALILKQMDLFIFPSLSEGLGLAVLEAQAIGLPVIASDIPGIQEIIKHEETGLLVPVKNPEAIYKAVNKLVAKPALAEKIIKQAQDQVVAKFSFDQLIKNYTNLYLKLLKTKK